MKDLTTKDDSSLPAKKSSLETEDKVGFTVWLGGAAAWGGYNLYSAFAAVPTMIGHGAQFTSLAWWAAKMLALTGGLMVAAPLVSLFGLMYALGGKTGEGQDERQLGWLARLLSGASSAASSYAVYHAFCLGALATLESAWAAYQLPWALVLGSLVVTTLVALFGGQPTQPQRVAVAQKSNGQQVEVPELSDTAGGDAGGSENSEPKS